MVVASTNQRNCRRVNEGRTTEVSKNVTSRSQRALSSQSRLMPTIETSQICRSRVVTTYISAMRQNPERRPIPAIRFDPLLLHQQPYRFKKLFSQNLLAHFFHLAKYELSGYTLIISVNRGTK